MIDWHERARTDRAEINHLRTANAVLEQAVRAMLEVVDPIHGSTIRVALDALSRSAAVAHGAKEE